MNKRNNIWTQAAFTAACILYLSKVTYVIKVITNVTGKVTDVIYANGDF
jgi:hypothetical protein